MPKIKWDKIFEAIHSREKLPRKVKKVILGKRMSKGELNKLLKAVEVIKRADTMYDTPEIKPYAFCPNCGCTEMRGTGNRASYPEHWEYFHCIRCNKIVGYIDNSPFIHALEFKDYDLVF